MERHVDSPSQPAPTAKPSSAPREPVSASAAAGSAATATTKTVRRSDQRFESSSRPATTSRTAPSQPARSFGLRKLPVTRGSAWSHHCHCAHTPCPIEPRIRTVAVDRKGPRPAAATQPVAANAPSSSSCNQAAYP